MRELILFMILAGIFVFASRSCDGDGWNFGFGVKGEGPVKTENRSPGDFHAVSMQIPGKVEVRVSDRFTVEVQAQENLLPILKTTVENGRLKIYFDENVSNYKDLVVRVAAPAFDALEVGGSGRLEVMDPLRSDRLELAIAGSGDMLLPDAEVNQLNCSIAGSGEIQVAGRTTDVTFDISGSGDIDAQKMAAEHARAHISGSGEVRCHANQTLKAGVAGSGDIYYSGAASVDSDVSGSGKIKRME